MIRRPPRSPLFPYPPLFRSARRTVERAPRPQRGEFQQLRELPSQEMRRSPFDEPGHLLRGEFPELLKLDRKSTRLNSSHSQISYAVFCLKKKNKTHTVSTRT